MDVFPFVKKTRSGGEDVHPKHQPTRSGGMEVYTLVQMALGQYLEVCICPKIYVYFRHKVPKMS